MISVQDFTSATIQDRYDDMISPPGLTNHWATVQADHDVLAVRSLNVPPLSQGDTVSGRLYLGGRLAQSYGEPVQVTWRPDRVRRTTVIDDWQIETVTVAPIDQPGVLVAVTVTNNGPARELRIGAWIDSTVTRSAEPWLAAEPPQSQNVITVAGARRLGQPGDTVPACSLQGLVDHTGQDVADHAATVRLIETAVDLRPGETWQGAYIHVIAADPATATTRFEEIARDQAGCIRLTEEAWNAELAAIFDPGDPTYSGSLPTLITSNEALRSIYLWGALGTIWFRRDNPASVLGRTYDTLMPRYWQTTTFIWDYSLSSYVHAQLDPAVMRRQIAHWAGLDINRHFGTEWLTGGPVGYWYSVNQYALVRLVADYVRFTGDSQFLTEMITGPDGSSKALGDHVRDWAVAWRDKRTASGLADYGEIDNLLECVPGYVHEVASLQAANVWCMRTAAALSELDGHADAAVELRSGADELVGLVTKLYRAGDGFFNTRMPDGSEHPTRHCYDFSIVGTTIADDLPGNQRAEMISFFDGELRSRSWMRALSPYDTDAGCSLRPDHQWNGAYPAWPADAGRALIKLGGAAVLADWLPGLARTTRQGPPGQAHFVEEAAEPIAGGARKAPGQWPYIVDWACSSAGAWCELVISGIFGVTVSETGEVTAGGCLDLIDPDARLEDLVVGGRRWSISRDGARPSPSPR